MHRGCAIGYRRLGGFFLAGLVLLCAPHYGSAQQRELLNSERIDARFGSYGIEVIAGDDRYRLSNLYSTDRATGIRTTRTIALVAWPEQAAAAWASEHRRILDGASIGATLQDAGWTVLKINVRIGSIDASPGMARLMRIEGAPRLALHLYALDLARAEEELAYARILEIHHPDYLDEAAVRRIYGGDPGDDGASEVDALLSVLRERGF